MAYKILVLVKEVTLLEDDFRLSEGAIDEQYFDYELNQFDEFAVEEAIQIKENTEDDVEVVSLTVGPERSEETIRMVLAKGVDRAVRLWDEALEDQMLLDASVKANLLASVVKDEDPDLILCGAQADDDMMSSTGVTLAQLLGFQWAAVVIDLDLDLAGGMAHVNRELEGGIEEITDVELPAVLSIQTGINDPRYASLRGIRQAQKKELASLSFDDVGLDSSVLDSPIRLKDLAIPETETDTEYFEGSADELAQQVVTLIKQRGVGKE